MEDVIRIYAFAVVVVAAVLVAWLLFRRPRPRSGPVKNAPTGRKSTHGFTAGILGRDELARRRVAERVAETAADMAAREKRFIPCIAENDAAIRSVLEEYKAIHCPGEEVQFTHTSISASWFLAYNQASSRVHKTCSIDICINFAQSATEFLSAEIWVDEGMPEPEQLEKALWKVLRHSKLLLEKKYLLEKK